MSTAHTHRSAKQAVTGQQDECITCDLPIMFDGNRWVWLHSLPPHKRRKFATLFSVNQLTGAH